jgi:predicted metal-binding membrane protein
VHGTARTRLIGLIALVVLGYFAVWAALGIVAYPVDGAIPPAAAGFVMLVAGMLQFTRWKAHHLACCREVPGPGRRLNADATTAWQHGLHLGLHCCHSSAGAMAILLAVGSMDMVAMLVVTAVITIERLAPRGESAARAIGVVTIAAGLLVAAGW